MKNEVCVLKEKVNKNLLSKNFSKEKQTLNDKVKYLETTLYKCVNEKKKMDIILGKKRYSLDKAGLDFNPYKKNIFKNQIWPLK